MKATLEFNLPEDNYEFDLARKAPELLINLENIKRQIRTCRKHGHNYASADELLDDLWENYIRHDLID